MMRIQTHNSKHRSCSKSSLCYFKSITIIMYFYLKKRLFHLILILKRLHYTGLMFRVGICFLRISDYEYLGANNSLQID